jgi:adenylate cyclase
VGAERVTRRLAAIVAADIAGYSRLIAADEEGTYVALRRHRTDLIDPKIKEYGGRIANTAGDSLLVEFPSVVDALRCSLDIQAGMRERNHEVPPTQRIEYRIGVNLGDVIEADGDLLGDGVNVAARLESLAEPGGICLSRAARDQVRDRLDISLEDLGEVEVKNIVRPIRVFRVREDQVHAQGLQGVPARRWRLPLLGIALCLLVAGTMAAFLGADGWRAGLRSIWATEREPGATQMRPALVVLPFANFSGDPAQDYFSDAFTEDITTALARTPGLLVVARNTAFTYKGKATNAQELGRDLGVRYMLEGSARRLGDMMRVTAQLIETGGGTHVWAERFDRPFADIFKIQDQLVDRIVGSVASRLRRHEGARALKAPPETLAAYDLTARASLLFRKNTPEAVGEARELLRRAIEIDPNYAKAHTVLSRVENFFFTSRTSNEYAQPETAARVVSAAARAVALAPDDAYAHAVYGMALRLHQDYDRAMQAAKRAKELAPTDPDVLSEVSSVSIGAGDYPAVVETVRLAMTLDPYLSPVFIGGVLSQALFALGDFAGAKEAADACLERTPNDVRCVESLTRALGELGPKAEAQRAAQRLLSLSPSYTVSEYKRRASRNRRDKQAIELWAEGLRKAGIPD